MPRSVLEEANSENVTGRSNGIDILPGGDRMTASGKGGAAETGKGKIGGQIASGTHSPRLYTIRMRSFKRGILFKYSIAFERQRVTSVHLENTKNNIFDNTYPGASGCDQITFVNSET